MIVSIEVIYLRLKKYYREFPSTPTYVASTPNIYDMQVHVINYDCIEDINRSDTASLLFEISNPYEV